MFFYLVSSTLGAGTRYFITVGSFAIFFKHLGGQERFYDILLVVFMSERLGLERGGWREDLLGHKKEAPSKETPYKELLGDIFRVSLGISKSQEVELRATLKDVLGTFKERNHRVLELRYGLDGKGKRTYKEIGEEFGISGSGAEQLKAVALKRLLRHPEISARLHPSNLLSELEIPQEIIDKVNPVPLSRLDLSVRMMNMLLQHGFRTTGEVLSRTREELLSLGGFGPVLLSDLELKLKRYIREVVEK